MPELLIQENLMNQKGPIASTPGSLNQWTLRDYLRVLFRQKRVIITASIVVTTVAFMCVELNTKEYEADVKMLVSGEKQIEAPYYKQLFDTENSPESLTQIEIVTADPVLERTVNVLKLYDRPFDYERKFASPIKKYLIDYFTKKHEKDIAKYSAKQNRLLQHRQAVEALRRNIKVEPVKDTNVFVIHVRDFDPVEAAVLANVISRSYVIFDLEQQLAELKLKYGPKHPIVMQLQDNIQEMDNDLSGKILPDTESIGPASVKIIQQASAPLKPTRQHRRVIIALALLTGIFFGMVLAYIFEYMDQSLKSTSELEELLQLPLLGNIPKIRRKRNMLINAEGFNPSCIKGFNNLADQITFLQSEGMFKSLALCACDWKDGNSFISANLATTLNEYSGKKILLMEANFRKPDLKRMFDVDMTYGLADILTSPTKLSDVLFDVAPNLTLMPAGETNISPMTLLGSMRMRELMQELRNKFDLIVIDTPELSNYRDALLISSLADKTLLVVAENHTRRQVALKTLNSFGQWKGRILGVVLNRRLYSIPRWFYNQV